MNEPRRKHLRRLDRIFESARAPLYFLTICVRHRRPVFADPVLFAVLAQTWQESEAMYGWLVGRYVVMPDHVHFFACPASKDSRSLSLFVGSWKRWTQKRIRESGLARFGWQAEFFDHLLRSNESYDEKWHYVRANPVRAGLVVREEDWPYQGEAAALRL